MIPKLVLPDDTEAGIAAMRALAGAGMLPRNTFAWAGGKLSGTDVYRPAEVAPCPRCQRDTVVTGRRAPTLCTGCRSGQITARMADLEWIAINCERCGQPCQTTVGRPPLCAWRVSGREPDPVDSARRMLPTVVANGGTCDVPGCAGPARLYAHGLRCDPHRPGR